MPEESHKHPMREVMEAEEKPVPWPVELDDAKEDLAAIFFQCARYQRPSTDWIAALNAFCERFIQRPAEREAEPVALPDELPEPVFAAVAQAIGGAYDCLRVWSAWGVGTMGPDDFAPVAEDGERIAEIARAAIKAWVESRSASPCPRCAELEAKQELSTTMLQSACINDVAKQRKLAALETENARLMKIADLVLQAKKNLDDKDWALMRIDLNEAAELAAHKEGKG